MSTPIDLIVLGMVAFFEWYAQEILDPRDLVLFFIRQLALYLILQVLLHLLPFLKRIANIIWFPFRFLHVYQNQVIQLSKQLIHQVLGYHNILDHDS